MSNQVKFKAGDIVRPANDGEDTVGRRLHWTRLTGIVVDEWTAWGEQQVQVRWHRRSPYPWRLPASWLRHG
jgi:hypothetical protein